MWMLRWIIALTVLTITAGWIAVQVYKVYPMVPGNALELKTTRNQEGWITPRFIFSDGTRQSLYVYCSDTNTWKYFIHYCTAGDKVFSGVPDSEVKVWRYTLTVTHFILECNGVSLLNFNFAVDGLDDGCQKRWAKEITGIIFRHSAYAYNDNGHLFMRITGTCKRLPSSWNHVKTSASFPVKTGEVITVSCAPGYFNAGDSQVTCLAGDQFTFEDEPQCQNGRR